MDTSSFNRALVSLIAAAHLPAEWLGDKMESLGFPRVAYWIDDHFWAPLVGILVLLAGIGGIALDVAP